MHTQKLIKISFSVVLGIGLAIPAMSQEAIVPSRVVERVNESKLLVLKGNTHFLARAEFDKGLVDPQLPMERMQLVLKRSAEQDAALQAFMAEQTDLKSPNYHHWLEPEEFGRLYGPSDSDMAAVTNWLQNHGFRIDTVSKGRVTIEFSGNAQQVQDAFHVEMHNYLVHGKAHIANDRDPQIPEALAPVVTGVASLHDFFPQHQSELGRYVSMDRKTHKATPVSGPGSGLSDGPHSEYSYLDPNLGVTNEDIGPYDFAAMYNLTPLWTAGITGKNVSIAIAAETDINLTDVATFRTFFGLSKFTGTAQMVLNGADPGTIQGAVVENTLDTEWAGAAAPDANVLVVATKGTSTSFGGLLSIEYIIDQKLAPVMSASYGTCEAGLGSAGNANLNSIYQQGSAEGISIFESAGDQGSTGCDNSDATTYPSPAQNGLQVNGFVSSPYVTGVGGTDIVWQEDAYSKYWTANTANHASAIGYIPEIPWNSTCTSSYLLTYVYTGQSSSEALCNNAISAGLDEMVRVVGGSGGKSSCLNYTGTFASCTSGYAKPIWQAGTGVPADGVRDVPDVSLFASGGMPSGNGGSAYLICVSSNSPDNTCDFTGSHIVAQEVGGTSVSSPAMAGIMAMVVQNAHGAYQGLANPVLYGLAAKETLSACNSNTVANGNNCVFYDVTTGTNAMPCLSGSLNCNVNTSGDNIGIVTGYTTTTGYDQATGLGSVNAYNLVNAWPSTSPTPAALTSPAQGSTFTGHSVSFTWSAATGATGYYLWIGSSGVGSNNIYNSAPKTGTSYTFPSMPTNGELIYVRLITNFAGTWVHNDYTYTAASAAAMTSPVAGSTFTGSSVAFNWSAEPSATCYYLLIGTTGAGSNNVYNSAPKTATSYTFTGMPTNGETIYVRLITNYSGTWLYNDYVYHAYAPAATLTAPAQGSTFNSTSVTFSWTTVSGATGYYLWIGSTGVGSNNLYNSAEKTVTSYTFTSMPVNGETIYVRLSTNYNGIWVSEDYSFTAQAAGIITAPATGSTLTGPSVSFTWSAATDATGYYLQIGSTGVGSNNLYNSAEKTVTSYTFTAMPTNGETIYVRLITNYSGTWVHNDYTYTASTAAAMTAPAALSTFTGPSVAFTWTAAPGATGYYLWIGSTGPGSNNIYNSAPKTVTTYTFTQMPTNGEPIYVRLITNYNGIWVNQDYTYTAK